MPKYRAINYSMGRPVKEATFEAANHPAAMREAERRVPGANALGQAGRKVTTIGVRVVK